MPERERGRRDHILPVGYLEGFTDAKGLLEVFHIKDQKWFPKKPDGVGYKPGFYDYSEGVKPDQTADDAFQEYEGRFPELRRELITSNFSDWRKHLDFLVRYINMFRVRSELFRQDFLQSLEQQPPMVAAEIQENVPHPKIPGQTATKVKFKPMPQTGEALKTAYNDLSISKMRADIPAVPPWFYEFNWCLRFTTDPKNPVITADTAIHFEGVPTSQERAIGHFCTRLHFPLCWQACLIGSPDTLLPHTKAFSQSRLSELRGKYLRSDCRFAYSPVIVSDL
jgi:hypothetical protein